MSTVDHPATDPADPDRSDPSAVPAPVAKRVPVERTLWGDTVIDDYRWLQDRTDPDVMALLEAENAYTDSVLEPMAELRDELYVEMKARIRETDISVPVRKDGWAYYSRTTEGDAYSRHFRLAVDDNDPIIDPDQAHPDEQLLLDENAEAEGESFFDVGVFEVSPDHRYLLWGADTAGNEHYTLRVRDLTTGQDLADEIPEVTYGSAWALDNATFFYVRFDASERPYQVWRHQLGRPVDDDVVVYQEDDSRFFVGVGRDKDDSWIYLASGSKVTDEISVIPADDPLARPRVLVPRRQGIEYSVVHVESGFVILTNDGAENFRVVQADEHDLDPDRWQELVAGSDEVFINDIEATTSFLALYERTAGSTRIRLRSWADGTTTTIDQPEEVSTTWPGANVEADTTVLRYGYSSMVTPPSVMTYDHATGERQVLKRQEVGGGFDAADYHSRRFWVTGEDGERIPVSYVARRDRPAGPGPCLLYGYGAYEVSIDPVFSTSRLSLLDRGFGFAIVHARGGGEMGRQWYLNGKLEHKPNTFADVVSAARFLIDEGITEPSKLVLRGGSAGGLMVGAVLNRAPELFAGAVADVPFVDALNTILDPDLPLTVTEWEEWGNPAADEAIYRVMRAYSPYENVESVAYPSVLAVAGLNDTRVSYWEPAKWVQRLRSVSQGDGTILLWTDLDSGHGGPSGRYDKLKEESRNLAYIIRVAGCTR